MIIELVYEGRRYKCDLQKPIDVSIPLGQVKCFYAPDFEATPYRSGDFIGAVREGAPVNFYNVHINPHGNGTHTECLGHITAEQEPINDQLNQFHFIAQLITVSTTELSNQDRVLSLASIQSECHNIALPEALLIRTRPNDESKLTKDYSGTNPPYIEPQAMQYLVDRGVHHLLIDLPSVDREEDGGMLSAHRIFWGLTSGQSALNDRKYSTITEMIYMDDTISDGLYLLNIQIAPFPLDASPSKPVIYKLYE